MQKESTGIDAMKQCNVEGEAARLRALHRYEILDTAPEEAFDRITRLVVSVLQMPMAVVSLVDHDRQWIKSRQGVQTIETARDVTFCTHTIEDTQPLIVPDALADPPFADSPFVLGEPYIRFYAGVPLRTRDGHNVGALCAMDTKVRKLTDQQVALLQDLARLVVDELELRLVAPTDSLTGAMSARSFIEQARREISRSQRNEKPLSWFVIDVDHFKAVNDKYGRAVGDLVLQQFVSICRSELRASDYLGRIGGEEFAVILPDTPMLGAVDLGERLLKMLAATTIKAAGHAVHITASVGVSECTDIGHTVEYLLQTADMSMNDAKSDGCNRVSCYFDSDLKVADVGRDADYSPANWGPPQSQRYYV
jgi:diguanylate cyclase (GGDEF)-like protein